MNTALLSSYLAARHFAPKNPTEDQTRELNRMALQLSMELPNDVLAVLFRKTDIGTYQHAWDVVDAVRMHATPDDPRGKDVAIAHLRPTTATK